jgi:hypothetical protein
MWNNSTEHNPYREANSRSSAQDIPNLLWNWKFHYHVQNRSPLDPVLCYLNLLHFFKTHFSTLLSPAPRPSK